MTHFLSESKQTPSFFQPGLNPECRQVLKCPGAKEAYILLKLLKAITSAKVKSYELKKIFCELRHWEGPNFAGDIFK